VALEVKTMIDVSKIYDEFMDSSGVSTVSRDDELAAVRVLNGLLPKSPLNWRLLINAESAQTVSDWIN
jgi:hypothetical protein